MAKSIYYEPFPQLIFYDFLLYPLAETEEVEEEEEEEEEAVASASATLRKS
jgi:hypothetical protein